MHMAEQKHLSNPALRGRLLVDEPMRKHLTWRRNWAADHAYVPADLDDAAQFLRSLSATEPIYFIGLGSNVLVRDGGIRGTVMLMHSSHAAVHMDGALVYAEARAASPKVARYAATHGYVGAEFLAGIPGTVGGALAMNAGCFGFERGDGAVALGRIRELLQQRVSAQPLTLPNAGSVFRNPLSDHAARLIEACGLKGYAIGGARVSEKHANFIVNAHGRGSAADIDKLIEHVRHTVLAKHGVELMTEVRIIGEAAA